MGSRNDAIRDRRLGEKVLSLRFARRQSGSRKNSSSARGIGIFGGAISRAAHSSERKIRVRIEVETIVLPAQQPVTSRHRDHRGVVGAESQGGCDDPTMLGL